MFSILLHSVWEREANHTKPLNSMRKHSLVQEYFSCLIIFNIIQSSEMHFSILIHKSQKLNLTYLSLILYHLHFRSNKNVFFSCSQFCTMWMYFYISFNYSLFNTHRFHQELRTCNKKMLLWLTSPSYTTVKKVLKMFLTDVRHLLIVTINQKTLYRPNGVPPKLKEVGTVCWLKT